MTARFTDGNVTITLDDGLERWVRSVLDAAATETIRILEAAAEEIAAGARGRWYTEVERDTGKSGAFETVTTFDTGRGEVRVGVRSLDARRGEKGRPVAVLVHRPGPLSQVRTPITKTEYNKAKLRGGADAKAVYRSLESGKCYRLVDNPKRSDGKYLFVELLRKPLNAKLKAITPELGRAIAMRVNGGG